MSGSWAVRVRALRSTLGVTQERFGTLVGASFVSVNRWEQGKAKPENHAAVLVLVELCVERNTAAVVICTLHRAEDSRARILGLAELLSARPSAQPPTSTAAA